VGGGEAVASIRAMTLVPSSAGKHLTALCRSRVFDARLQRMTYFFASSDIVPALAYFGMSDIGNTQAIAMAEASSVNRTKIAQAGRSR
jgi:hypothetical protein